MSSLSKAKGKTGEREVRRYLESHGWFIAGTEIQGLAGDDIFAQDVRGKWWSIEVKNTKTLNHKYLTQAREQCDERRKVINRELNDKNSMSRRLGIDGDIGYMLIWKPSHWNNAKQLVVYNGDTASWEVW